HSASAVSSVHSPGRSSNGPPPTISVTGGTASRLAPSSVAPSASPIESPTSEPTARSQEWVFFSMPARYSGDDGLPAPASPATHSSLRNGRLGAGPDGASVRSPAARGMHAGRFLH